MNGGSTPQRKGRIRATARVARVTWFGWLAVLALTHGIAVAEVPSRGMLVPESSFLPPAGASAALEKFEGTLVISEASMQVTPAKLATMVALERDPTLFPAARIGFTSLGRDLVPITQDLIPSGSAGVGRSYWDILVQPGETWHQPGDGAWSRAAFPFALANAFENETHNGIATFRYRHGEVADLKFQVSAQTAPFVIETPFSARGSAPVQLEPLPPGRAAAARRRYAIESRDSIPIADWTAFAQALGKAPPDIDGGIPREQLVLDGVDYHGVFYLRVCQGVAGPLAWCQRRRFGVWSATKSLANSVALLRLAQKYGPSIFDARIVDYVPELRDSPPWKDVRFGDAISMATGVGNGRPDAAPDATEDGYLDGQYMRWYFSRSTHEKLEVISHDSPAYPWGPGKVVRYRDQDMFTLGVALDRYLKRKAGPSADIWNMLEREVYAPIGILEAPVNRTLEPDGPRAGQPLMAWGYYPTLGDVLRIARLYQAHGEWAGRQILYKPRIDLILDPQHAHGLPAGPTGDGAEIDYFNTFWRQPYRVTATCRQYVPEMRGYGNVTVALFPNGMTGLRVASSLDTTAPGQGLGPLASIDARCVSPDSR